MKTLRKVICSLLALLLVLGMLPAALADGDPQVSAVTAEIFSHFTEKTYTDTFYYSDGWFLADPAETNYALALMSAVTGGVSFSSPSDSTGAGISALMAQLGFSDVQRNDSYARGIKTEDSVGCIIGRKTITDSAGKAHTLLAVFFRNAGYEYEWISNFSVGESGYHAGFVRARDQVLDFMEQYIREHGITGAVKVWSAGYSRGAAVANLLGGYLAEHGNCFGGVTVVPGDLFVYTIGSPATIAGEAAPADPAAYPYNGIHNFVASGDYISKLPPTDWGFARYGVTENVEYGDAAMRAWLGLISPETAAALEGGGYSTPREIKTLDVGTLSLAGTGASISPDAMLAERLSALVGLAGSRAEMVGLGYQRLLGDVTVIYGADRVSFINGVSSASAAELVKAAVLNYLAYALEQQRAADPGISDDEAVAEVLKQLFALAGKANVDTDQMMLAGLLDYLINDYQQDEPLNKAAKARAAVIENALPSEYQGLYSGLLNYAAEQKIRPQTADELLYLLAGFVMANRTDPSVKALILALIRTILPTAGDEYYDLVCELFIMPCVSGSAEEAGKSRATLLNMLCTVVPGNPPRISKLIMNGSYYSVDGDTEPPVRRYYDPAPLSALVGEVLDLLLKDGDGRASVTAAADQTLIGLLELGRTEKIGKYITELEGNPGGVRRVAAALLFRPGDGYALAEDLRNGTTFIGSALFIFPAHFHELYLSWLKTKVSARVVFESNDGSAVEDVVGLAFGARVPKPADPTRTDYAFDGWCKDAALTQPWSFGTDTVQSVCTVLYARWKKTNSPGGGFGPSAEEVTVPIFGEGAAVDVKATIKDGAAVIKEADIDKVLSAGKVGTVTVDLSALDQSIRTTVVPGAMFRKIADAVADEKNDADGLEIRLPGGSVRFDGQALGAVAGAAGSGDLTLKLDSIKLTELNSAQQEALDGLSVEAVLDVCLTVNGQRVSDLGGGSATVRIPCALGEGQDPKGLAVWYVPADGTKTEAAASFDGKTTEFRADRLANYAVTYDGERAAACPKDASCPIAAFTDADPTAWYHDGVHWALETGVMQGLGNGVFQPDGTTTRAQVAMILWNMEGRPAAEGGIDFADVTADAWYADAVRWASGAGVINGWTDETGAQVFAPDSPVTREQFAAMLYRCAGLHGEGFRGAWVFLLEYPDAADVADWADEAMHYWVMQGVINGMDGRLNPQGNATRAQVASMLCRFVLGA